MTKKQKLRDYNLSYNRSFHGMLRKSYYRMKRRTQGKDTNRPHLYLGKKILPQLEFLEWAFSSKKLNRLYQEWVDSDFEPKLRPSVDRIDSSGDYLHPNIRWITNIENKKLGVLGRKKKKKAS